MTIREFAVMLDDYSGSLSQSVDKLEIERARGHLEPDEELDLIHDMQEAFQTRFLRPWRHRLLLGLGAGIGLMAFLHVPLEAELDLPFQPWLKPTAAGLGGLLLLWAMYCGWRFYRLRSHEGHWLREAERHVVGGNSVLNL